MLWQFRVIFAFFVEVKKKKLRMIGLKAFHNVVIGATYVLWVLGIIDSFNTTFIFALDQSSFSQSGSKLLQFLW